MNSRENATGLERLTGLKIILGHDYLIQMGGAERVVASLHRAFPKAPIYVSAVSRGANLKDFETAEIRTTWMQHIPGIEKHFKKFFFLYAQAFASLGVVDADVAIISSSGFSKWLRFTPRTRVFCYCHTPPRFFWQTDAYLEYEVANPLLRKALKVMLPRFRKSDFKCAQKITHFIANSEFVSQRIREFYGRDSTVIYPPIDISRFRVTPLPKPEESYYVILARLVSYKSIDRAVRAFSENGKRLVIIGDGPDRKRLESLASSNVEFLGRRDDAEVKACLEKSYALVFPGTEDFGIAPLEANACGRPVLAFARGGALETVVDGVTGMFFSDPAPDKINEALARFEQVEWQPEQIRRHAERFGEGQFLDALTKFIVGRLD